jgi:hypothetical protein
MSDRKAILDHWRKWLHRHYDSEKQIFIRIDDAYCREAADCLERGQMPPPYTIKKAVAKLRAETISDRTGLRGGDPSKDLARNVIFALTAFNLSQELRLDPTRNEATEQPSGCSLAKEFLDELGVELSEKRLNEIYSEMAKELGLILNE